jgi:predicted ATPase
LRIINFTARKVHGQLNIDLNFSNQITFLVGNNGSGKTSALKLMQAAFTLDLGILYSIKFSSLRLDVENNGSWHRLQIENLGQFLKVSFDSEVADATIPLLADEEIAIYSKNGRLEEFLEEKRFHFLRSTNKNLRDFLDKERPLFLGLERRTSNTDIDKFYLEDEYLEHRHRPITQMRRGTIEGLDNCERLVEQAYRRFRRVSDTRGSHLTNIIVESTFDYIEFEPASFVDGTDFQLKEVKELLLRKHEIEQFANALGGGNRALKKIRLFFSKIDSLLKTKEFNQNRNSIDIELLMNKAQIRRMLKILAEMEEQKSLAEKVYSPIKQFVDSMNEFFESSKKTVEVDSVGRLKVTQNGTNIPLMALSSGEKQLLILIAHSMFAKKSGSVFIVDEPELSLHLRWQEMLVDSLVTNEKNNQFIFATHSPEIIGYKKENCIQVA